jgi:tRNA(fMet)-specific endonuclease VapC
MDKRFLLDSNLISELSKPQPNANVLTNIQRFEPLCAISAITLQEALFGVELLPDGSRKNKLKDYVEIVKQKFDVIPHDTTTAAYYAEVIAKCNKAGQPRPICDSQIAATALANDLILVTRNTKDFEPIAKITPLKLENWFET